MAAQFDLWHVAGLGLWQRIGERDLYLSPLTIRDIAELYGLARQEAFGALSEVATGEPDDPAGYAMGFLTGGAMSDETMSKRMGDPDMLQAAVRMSLRKRRTPTEVAEVLGDLSAVETAAETIFVITGLSRPAKPPEWDWMQKDGDGASQSWVAAISDAIYHARLSLNEILDMTPTQLFAIMSNIAETLKKQQPKR